MSSNECAGLQTQYDVFSLDKAETLALLHGCGFSYEELKKPRVAVFNTLNPHEPRAHPPGCYRQGRGGGRP